MRTAPTITNGGTLTVVNGSSPVNITSFNVADNHHGRSALLYGNTASWSYQQVKAQECSQII